MPKGKEASDVKLNALTAEASSAKAASSSSVPAEIPLALVQSGEPRSLDAYVQASRDKISSVLNKSELQLLDGYTNCSYALDNKLLRTGAPSDPWKQLIDKLVDGGLGVEGSLFRTVSDPGLVEAGKRYRDPAPGSATVDAGRAMELTRLNSPAEGHAGLVMIIEGATAANISGASDLDTEYEALIRPGQEFEVKSKVFDEPTKTWIAHLEAVKSDDSEAKPAASPLAMDHLRDNFAGLDLDLLEVALGHGE